MCSKLRLLSVAKAASNEKKARFIHEKYCEEIGQIVIELHRLNAEEREIQRKRERLNMRFNILQEIAVPLHFAYGFSKRDTN